VSWERVSWLAHSTLPIQDPITSEQLDTVVAACAVSPDDLAVDLGCGAGELLARLVERWGCRGIGIDLAATAIERARPRAPQIEWRVDDARNHGVREAGAALVACIGASHAFGGMAPALAELVPLARAGGFVLLGEGYWRVPPPDDWLAALGAARDELTDRDGVLAALEACGLRISDAVDASPTDIDDYNGAWRANLETHLRVHADDEEVRGALNAAEAWHRDCGRYLGFGAFVAIKG
jgi:SAM-dependent methyltransferase